MCLDSNFVMDTPHEKMIEETEYSMQYDEFIF